MLSKVEIKKNYYWNCCPGPSDKLVPQIEPHQNSCQYSKINYLVSLENPFVAGSQVGADSIEYPSFGSPFEIKLTRYLSNLSLASLSLVDIKVEKGNL